MRRLGRALLVLSEAKSSPTFPDEPYWMLTILFAHLDYHFRDLRFELRTA